MEAGDLDFALKLAKDEGWDYFREDFERLLSYSPGGCFIATADGRDCGMVTTTPYGESSAFIGCLLVDPAMRGRKRGEALFDAALDHLRSSGVSSVHLEALPRAVGLYRRKGFKTLWQSLRLLGMEARTPFFHSSGEKLEMVPGLDVRPYEPGDLEKLIAVDHDLTGLDRSDVLRDLLGRFGNLTFVCLRENEVVGFLSARPATRGYRLGPWVCKPDGEVIPRMLLDIASRTFEGEKLFVGLPAVNTVAVNLLKRHGFRDGLTCSRMRWGEDASDGDPNSIFGIASAEKG
jgi:ribosomal protein S18 acetylase RimI-like enzyme